MPKPTLVQRPDTPATTQGERGVNRLKSLLSRQAVELEMMLSQLRRAVEKNGRQAIEDALGPDADELPTLYNALKTAAETLGCEDIRDLPDVE